MKNRVYDNKRGLRQRLLRDLSVTKRRCRIDAQQFSNDIQSARGFSETNEKRDARRKKLDDDRCWTCCYFFFLPLFFFITIYNIFRLLKYVRSSISRRMSANSLKAELIRAARNMNFEVILVFTQSCNSCSRFN